MSAALGSLFYFIIAISVLVAVHEYGHYIVGRWCGMKVLRFSIGFGKPLVRWRDRRDTEYVISALPLGGYVKMLDEREGFVPDDQKHLAFNRKPVLQRIAIVAAGPIANFLLAIVAYWFLFSVGVTGIVPKLGDIDPESAAGLLPVRATAPR